MSQRETMKQNSELNRRRFLQRTAGLAGMAAGAQYFGMPALLSAAAPNSKLGVAVIGCGGMGGGNPDVAANERCVALVDADENRLGEAVKRIQNRVPNPKTYFDYRKMYDECGKDLDVVLIATPDHHHGPAAIRAIKLGKAAFVQKPLAHNIRECYELAKAAKEHKVMTQMGNQGHYGESIRRVCENIWAGAIGKVTEVHAFMGRNFGGSGKRPASKPVPAGLHWDEWLGPAPFREYHDKLHPFDWRSWRDFGTGTVGDMACHNLDTLFWALKLGEAKKFTIECLNTKGGNEEMWPQDNVVRWEFEARGDLPPVKIHAYDEARLRPEVVKEIEKKYNFKAGEDTIFIGDKGMIRIQGTSGPWQFLPDEMIDQVPKPPKTLPRAHGGPISDLLYCLKNGGSPCSNFPDSAAPLTSFAQTSHLAQFAGVGKKLEWDVEKMECTNVPEINKYVRRTYRPGWEV
jgi:predicted dehydrogenase